jgi:DNA-directed RNA polymerase specialized sigma24 family protein
LCRFAEEPEKFKKQKMANRTTYFKRTCTGAHLFRWGNFSVLSSDEMSPVHFYLQHYQDNPDELRSHAKADGLDLNIYNLPDFLQEVVYFHYYKDLSIEQIGLLVKRDPIIVQRWLLHAIGWLRILMKPRPPTVQ